MKSCWINSVPKMIVPVVISSDKLPAMPLFIIRDGWYWSISHWVAILAHTLPTPLFMINISLSLLEIRHAPLVGVSTVSGGISKVSSSWLVSTSRAVIIPIDFMTLL